MVFLYIVRAKAQKTKRVSQLFYKITREFLNNLTFFKNAFVIICAAREQGYEVLSVEHVEGKTHKVRIKK